MTRMQDEAATLEAAGVVGSHVATGNYHVWKHRFIEFLAFGTAIEPLEGETDPLPLSLSVSIDG